MLGNINGDVSFTPLTINSVVALVHTARFAAIIDISDWPLVSQRKWYHRESCGHRYVGTKINGKTVELHRFLFGDAPVVDHVNRNGLDNRRENLRAATWAQNLQNRLKKPGKSSKFLGVHRDNRKDNLTKRWRASIDIDGKKKQIGRFENEEDAARAYNSAASILFGEFANLNPV